jgi:hypothetical protein
MRNSEGNANINNLPISNSNWIIRRNKISDERVTLPVRGLQHQQEHQFSFIVHQVSEFSLHVRHFFSLLIVIIILHTVLNFVDINKSPYSLMKRRFGEWNLSPPRRRNLLSWAQSIVAGFPPRRPGLEPRSVHMICVEDTVALGQVFSEYFGSPVKSHSINCCIFINHSIIDGI